MRQHTHCSNCLCSDLEKEEQANAVLFRNTFGTQPKRALGPLQNAFDLYLKNPANTNVVLWGERLLALWEVYRLHLFFGFDSPLHICVSAEACLLAGVCKNTPCLCMGVPCLRLHSVTGRIYKQHILRLSCLHAGLKLSLRVCQWVAWNAHLATMQT